MAYDKHDINQRGTNDDHRPGQILSKHPYAKTQIYVAENSRHPRGNKQYNLRAIVTEDGFVYCEICKGMYSLPQSGIIAQELLEELLAKVGYTQSKIIPRLWKHHKRNILFCLVDDDFAVKYTQKEDVNHSITALKQDYTATEDWEATKYLVLTIQWDFIK
jgi:hypothetical protein